MIQIGQQRNPADTVTQHVYTIEKHQKTSLLLHLLQDGQMYSVLIFCRTKRGADRISRSLAKAGVSAVAIHSDRTQKQRQRAMDGFRAGRFQVMVATDVAARGIDVNDISHVINYDVPRYAEDYIHRIGRTGRAESTGDAITFVARDEMVYLDQIEQYIGCKLKPKKCAGFTYKSSTTPAPETPAKNKKTKFKGKRKTKYKKYNPKSSSKDTK